LYFAYGFSAGFFVEVQTGVLGKAIEVSGLQTETAVAGIGRAFLAMVCLGLSMVFLSSYGAVTEAKDRNTHLAAGLVVGVIMLFVFSFSLISFLLFLFCLTAGWFAPAFGDMYYKELTRWKLFRTGAKTAGKMLLIFNVLLAVGVFGSIASNSVVYQEQFKAGFSDMLSSSLGDFEKTIEEQYGNLPEAQKAEILEQVKHEMQKKVEETMLDSPLFQTYMQWLPLVAALAAWIGLEFLRSLVLGNIAGVFSSVWMRVSEKI
jgi:hypothetical protein